jgi:hypothetical protein
VPAAFAVGGALLAALMAAGCTDFPAVLTQLVEAGQLAANLRGELTRAADAANRAVMADTDEASAAAVREAQAATEAVQRDADRLETLVKSLGYADELRSLETFKKAFAEYRKLDAEILPLAGENTNLKAQRLSFGPARETVAAFREALAAAGRTAAARDAVRAEALAAKAAAAVLEIQVIEARHIAEAEDEAMSRMEAQVAALEGSARSSVDALKRLLPTAAAPHLSAAAAALDRFKSIDAEIVTLSRRNSNVRSLALSLGRKRTVTAECDAALRALQEALAKHDFTGTR